MFTFFYVRFKWEYKENRSSSRTTGDREGVGFAITQKRVFNRVILCGRQIGKHASSVGESYIV